MCDSCRGLTPLLSVLAFVLIANRALAQRSDGDASDLPVLRPPPTTDLSGKRVDRIDIVFEGELWREPIQLRRVKVGDPLTPEVARRALRELTDTGRFADARAEVVFEAGRTVLRLTVVPRRLIAAIRLEGSPLPREEVLTAVAVELDGPVTGADLPRIAQAAVELHRRRGYPRARARANLVDTDDPRRVLLVIVVDAGAPRLVASRRFVVEPLERVGELPKLIADYAVGPGDPVDEDSLEDADAKLADALQKAGWHRAEVEHRIDGKGRLSVLVNAGPLVLVRFARNDTFDDDRLERALLLGERDDYSTEALTRELEDYYRAHGFLDVKVGHELRTGHGGAVTELLFQIREGRKLVVSRRHYPCLRGPLSAEQLDAELDGFLAEALPGDDVLRAVDAEAVDEVLGPNGLHRRRVQTFEPLPWQHYVPEVYERAIKHLEDLYRARGYLSVSVGPVKLVRRQCVGHTQPGVCKLAGPAKLPDYACEYDEVGVPVSEPEPPASSCTEDARKGVRCEAEAQVVIPIKLGPQTMLYDVTFEGNHALLEQDLAEQAALELGEPVSLVEIEAARHRVLDLYAESAYAFAEVQTNLDLSADQTRGRVRFVIAEREQVRVSRIEVRGAERTQEGLIRRRIALEVGGLYRRSLVRQTEEQLATLGVFSSITVGLEDPYVPAREKVVLITLSERNHQYLDIRPGFSTGEGFRITFEYGHRSLGGSAIQLTLRSQLGILPVALIFEKDVRDKFEELNLMDRLERRNSATVEFPEIGLGPRFRLSVEGLDVRDNSRDFGITKDAGILTLLYRPARQFSVQLGGSVELNDASIFGEEQKGALEEYVRNNPQLRNAFRIPEGRTVAVAQRVEFAWDRRDQPLDATRGTFVAAGVEHVQAWPVGEDAGDNGVGVFAATPSHFLRYTNRLAVYVPLDDEGLALATSFRWGAIQQLDPDSRTYPDRLFFMGGFDTMRGFLQDAMIPEDVAARLLASAADPACRTADPAETCLTTNEVVVRGGDFFVNPRAELRVPLTETLRTALFLDTGNLWTTTDPDVIFPLKLRYAVGTGLRVGTPIGPLVFDYGLNVERVLDRLVQSRTQRRFWEEIGAFHFSIGVF